MIQQPVLIHDIIPLEKQEELKNIMFKSLFPWFYRDSIASKKTEIFDYDYQVAPGFAHVFYNRDGKIGNFLDHTHPIIDNACRVINFKVKELLFARSFFQLPLTTHQGLTIPHVDVDDREHLVLLYYVLDADGDTVFFNKTHTYGQTVEEANKTPLLEKDITHKIRPKQGSVLAFNGNMYHANYLPKEGIRCIINFNLTEDI